MRIFKALIALLWLCACQNPQPKREAIAHLEEGDWRGQIAMNDSINLPFTFALRLMGKDSFAFHIPNARDTVKATLRRFGQDSFRVDFPVFANYLTGRITDSTLRGEFVNPDASDYRLPFQAHLGQGGRFRGIAPSDIAYAGDWATWFSPPGRQSKPAIAFFESHGSAIFGNFRTETGDYRFLEGQQRGDSLYLSTFDGMLLYYFAIHLGDTLEGVMYSGRSYYAPFKAYRDSTFHLRDPDSLTYLKEGYQKLEFALPRVGQLSDSLNLKDPRFEGKAVVVQIMGSWCPNCLDEGRYLRELYKRYRGEGLEIVGLTFERAADRATAEKRALKFIRDLDLPYPILLATATRQEKAEEVLPMLNHIMSYPTTLYLNRRHELVRIHTGFSGPGSPVYEHFVRENDAFIQQLLN